MLVLRPAPVTKIFPYCFILLATLTVRVESSNVRKQLRGCVAKIASPHGPLSTHDVSTHNRLRTWPLCRPQSTLMILNMERGTTVVMADFWRRTQWNSNYFSYWWLSPVSQKGLVAKIGFFATAFSCAGWFRPCCTGNKNGTERPEGSQAGAYKSANFARLKIFWSSKII